MWVCQNAEFYTGFQTSHRPNPDSISSEASKPRIECGAGMRSLRRLCVIWRRRHMKSRHWRLKWLKLANFDGRYPSKEARATNILPECLKSFSFFLDR